MGLLRIVIIKIWFYGAINISSRVTQKDLNHITSEFNGHILAMQMKSSFNFGDNIK